jgi:hypothetical protein
MLFRRKTVDQTTAFDLLKERNHHTETRKELEALRRSIKRVVEMTQDAEIIALIPKEGSERGWNLVCAILGKWIEQRR